GKASADLPVEVLARRPDAVPERRRRPDLRELGGFLRLVLLQAGPAVLAEDAGLATALHHGLPDVLLAVARDALGVALVVQAEDLDVVEVDALLAQEVDRQHGGVGRVAAPE